MSAADIAFDYPVAAGGGTPPSLPPLPRRWASPPAGKGAQPAAAPVKPVAAGAVLARPSALKLRLIAKRYAWHRMRAELATWRAALRYRTAQAEQAQAPEAPAAADRPRIARAWQAWQEGRELHFEYLTEETQAT